VCAVESDAWLFANNSGGLSCAKAAFYKEDIDANCCLSWSNLSVHGCVNTSSLNYFAYMQ
jgi:hypothetical protein